MLSGATLHEIHDAIQTTWPDAAGVELLAAVRQQLRDEADIDADLLRGWCFHATRELYRKMVEIGDFSGALRAVKMLSDMRAADVPT